MSKYRITIREWIEAGNGTEEGEWSPPLLSLDSDTSHIKEIVGVITAPKPPTVEELAATGMPKNATNRGAK